MAAADNKKSIDQHPIGRTKVVKLITTLACFLTFLVAGLTVNNALAHDYTIGNIEVSHPWARATVATAKSGGAYMVIENEGAAPDRLVSVSSPIAKKTHLHTTTMENDIMKMRSVDAVDIPAGGIATLKPGGFHVMFMGLKEPLHEGEMFPLTLTFEKAGTLEIMVHISEAGAMEEMGMEMHKKSDDEN